MRTLREAIIIGLAVVALGSCETTVERPRYPQLTYGHLLSIRFDVARVDVIREYVPPGQPPNVEHLFPVKPPDAAEQWARDRLVAAGADGVVRAIVKKASVVEVPLKQSGGLRGMLTTEQTERYDAVIEMVIEVDGPPGKGSGSVSAEARRSRTVPENLTINEREKVWFEMTEAMMNDLNASLESQIKAHLERFLR